MSEFAAVGQEGPSQAVAATERPWAAAERIVFANATLVLAHETVRGSVLVEDGRIVSIDQGRAAPAGAIDCEGEYLCPGLIELHTDNLERHMEPRPGVRWPLQAAILAHDGEFASVGVTTLFDALRVGSLIAGGPSAYKEYARGLADALIAIRRSGALRIEHRLHLRAEICSETLVEELDAFGEADEVGILSLMDHTPGQRQFRDLAQLELYLKGKRAMTRAQIDAHFARMRDVRARFGDTHEAAAVAAARRFGAVLASHDDTTDADVRRSAGHGVGFAEFPTTLEAAKACRAVGTPVMMGAPNLLRGGSHSGNVAAMELAEAGLLDALSSDYAPASLLQGAVRLGEERGNLADGLALATSGPARAVGLADRGALEPGLRADLLRFATIGGAAVTRGLWREGRRVG